MDCTTQTVKLLSGFLMPLVGLGTFQIRGTELTYNVMDRALDAGYRSFDTAAVYKNERDIGLALKTLLPKYKLTRESVFITSKLSPSDHGRRVDAAIDTSLNNLGLDYLDLYLIHWPGASGIPTNSTENKALRFESWEGLIRAKNSGKARSIGVSNYAPKHINELIANSKLKPDVNQVEWHPHHHEDELLDLCRKEGILFQAFSSLGTSDRKDLITDPKVIQIANKLNKSPAQILLKWACQEGIGIIPKARSKQHIDENFHLNFIIPEEDMKTLSSMQKTRYDSDPTVVV